MRDPHLLPLTLETEQLAATDLDIRVLQEGSLENTEPHCVHVKTVAGFSQNYGDGTAQQPSLPSTQSR